MKKLKTVILCGSAMSSGLIVEDIKSIANKFNVEVEIECFASLRFKNYDYSNLDVVVLAPQVKSQEADIRKYLDEKNIALPIYTIPMRDYGLVRGEKILKDLLQVIESTETGE